MKDSRIGRRLEGIALLLITVAALLFQRSATASWFEAQAPNGHRLLISPIGMQDRGTVADTTIAECRWWPRLGDAQLCELAPEGTVAMASVRRAYPLTFVSLWTCVLAVFLVALRIPRIPRVTGIIVTGTVPVMGVIAFASIASNATRALNALSNAQLKLEPGAFAGVLGGAILTTIAVILLITSRSGSNSRVHDETRTGAVVPLHDELRRRPGQ